MVMMMINSVIFGDPRQHTRVQIPPGYVYDRAIFTPFVTHDRGF